MLINRDIIKNDYYPIDRVKNHLRNAGAKKGDLVTISIMSVDVLHIASIFACAEMGLKIVILDSPATLESLPYTKLALHGPSQFYIYSSDAPTDMIYDGLHDEMLKRYGGVGVDVFPRGSEEPFHVDVSPTDPFLLSSTSGTTKPSRPVLFSHRETYEISKRNIDIFDFKEDSVVCHSRNLHHASALLTSLLPSLMAVDKHYTQGIGHDMKESTQKWLHLCKRVKEEKTTHIMIPNRESLMNFLETLNQPFEPTLNINMCGFALDEEFVELAKEYGVCFFSHFGSIDTAIPLLINRVGKDSTITPNSLGVLADDFYQFDGKEVRCELWDEPRYIEDEIELKDGQYILHPKPRNDIEIPEGFDLSPFSQDTKINYEQLRGHLHTISP